MQWIIGASDLIHVMSSLLSDATRFVVLALRSRAALTAENLFLRKTKPRRADAAGFGFAVQAVRLEGCSHRGQAGDSDRLASQRLSAVLEVEIEAQRTAASPAGKSER
jgi:hypothetical protein